MSWLAGLVDSAVVVRTGALGDFICTLPVLNRLADQFPVVLVAPNRYQPLFPRAARWVDSESTAAMALFRGDVDLSAAALGIAWTAAADSLRIAGIRDVYTGSPRPSPGIAIHDHLWEPLLPRFGPRDRDPQLPAIRTPGSGPLVIAPGSGGSAKRWPLSAWNAVASQLSDVLWVRGPLEQDEPGWGTPCLDELDIAGLIELATRCRGWLGPDSGPSHLAAAVGAPVGVVFNGTTDPANWSPSGSTAWVNPDVATVVAWAKTRGVGE